MPTEMTSSSASRKRIATATAMMFLVFGCSSSGSEDTAIDPDQAPADDAASAEPDETRDPEQAGNISAEESYDEEGRIVAECRGLDLVGLRYSPGGTTLPNRCAPFDMRTNNPYAVRCIDAMPEFETPFPGDDSCILPPPPDLGFQVGVHPGGNADYWEKMWAGDSSFYDDPAITAGYELAAGDETNQNYHAVLVGPTADQFFYRRQFRARYGSHHGMVRFAPSAVTEEGWQGNGDPLLHPGEIITVNNAYLDYPQYSLELPSEEAGVGYPANSNGVAFNLHHFNNTDGPLLRENWVNVWYIPADEVTKEAFYTTIQAPVSYPPGMVVDSAGSAQATVETQVLSLVAHRHAWTKRLHAWVVRAGSTEQELVYDSYDWFDMPTFSYNSQVMNPLPGTDGIDGATSGPLVLQAGDVLHFNCHVDTTQERANELGIAMPSGTLRFGNQAYDAEMCLLNGHTAGGRLGISF